MDVNVTTVDPAVAGLASKGLAYTDPNRQMFYDKLPRFEHTVVGGTGSWYPTSISGVSNPNITQDGNAVSGRNTNWVFSGVISSVKNAGEIIAHENGHALGLYHQSDVIPNTPTSTTYSTNGGASGNGSYAPMMGTSSKAQRGTFRHGTNFNGTIQDDVATINNLPGMRPVDDGFSHDPSAPRVGHALWCRLLCRGAYVALYSPNNGRGT